MPIVRTFVPFVAGAAEMSYPAVRLLQRDRRRSLWVGLCLGAGYLFGNVPIVKENFSLVALGIVAGVAAADGHRVSCGIAGRGRLSPDPSAYAALASTTGTTTTPAARTDGASRSRARSASIRSRVVLMTSCRSGVRSTRPFHR